MPYLQARVMVNDESVDFVLDLSSGSASEGKEIPSGDKVCVNYYTETKHSPGEVWLTSKDDDSDEHLFEFELENGACVKEVEYPLSTFAVEHLDRPPLRIKIEAKLVS